MGNKIILFDHPGPTADPCVLQGSTLLLEVSTTSNPARSSPISKDLTSVPFRDLRVLLLLLQVKIIRKSKIQVNVKIAKKD